MGVGQSDDHPLSTGSTDGDILRVNPSIGEETSGLPEAAPTLPNAGASADTVEAENQNPLLDFRISDDLTFSSISARSTSRDADGTELPSLPIEPINSGDGSYNERPASQIKPLFGSANVPARHAEAKADAETSEAETSEAGDGDGNAEPPTPAESDTRLSASADKFAWLTAESLGLPSMAENYKITLKEEISKTARHRAR